MPQPSPTPTQGILLQIESCLEQPLTGAIIGLLSLFVSVAGLAFTWYTWKATKRIEENIAKDWNLTREMQDEFALNSQLKAEKAIKEGKFVDEIVPVVIPQRKGEPKVFDQDEFPRFGATIEKPKF